MGKTLDLLPLPPPNGDNGNDKKDGNDDALTKILAEWLPAIFLVIYLVLTIIAAFNTTSGGIHWWALVIVVAFCHFVLGSIKIIREQEMAVLIFSGLILREWKSGLHFVMWPLYYVRRATKNSIQVEFGTIDENSSIERANKSEQSISWFVMKEPVRINWGDIKSSGLSDDEQKVYANDPYASTLTTDPRIYFRIRISNLKYLIERVGGIDEAIERIKDTCVSVLTEMAGKTFVAKARKEMGQLSKEIREKVEDLVGDPEAIARAIASGKTPPKSWGIDVEEVRIKDIGAPHAANTALATRAATIAIADGEATATIRTAEADRIKVEKAGVGNAAAVVSAAGAEKVRLTQEGEGRAAALKATAEAVMTNGGELILKTDALKAVMTASGGKIVVVPSDLSSLMGTIVGAVETVGSLKEKSPDAPTSRTPKM